MGLRRCDGGRRVGLGRVVDGGVWTLHGGGCSHRLRFVCGPRQYLQSDVPKRITYQLDRKVQLHYVDFEGSDVRRNTNFPASAEPESAAGWLGKVTADRSAGCTRRQRDSAVARVGSRSPHAVAVAEDVKAPVLDTNGVDDAA